MIKENDPNLGFGKTTIRFTLMEFDFSGEFEAVVGGNCRGYSLLDCAVSSVMDKHPEGIVLKNKDGDTLVLDDCEFPDEDSILDLLVKSEVINRVPE